MTAPRQMTASNSPEPASQEVAHALALGPQVGDVLGVRLRLQRHPFDDVEPEALEAPVLGGVVRHVAQGGDAEVNQDLGADAVLAAVYGQAQLDVGVDRVPP